MQEAYPVGSVVEAVVFVRRTRLVRDKGGERVLNVLHSDGLELPLSWFTSAEKALNHGCRYKISARVKWYQVSRGQAYMVVTRLKWRHLPFPGEADRNANATLPE